MRRVEELPIRFDGEAAIDVVVLVHRKRDPLEPRFDGIGVVRCDFRRMVERARLDARNVHERDFFARRLYADASNGCDRYWFHFWNRLRWRVGLCRTPKVASLMWRR